MPHRKYNPEEGTNGPIYRIIEGITVCRNNKGKWLLKVNRGGKRKNKTVGTGCAGRDKAIIAGEKLAHKFSELAAAPATPSPQTQSTAPIFSDCSKRWLKNTSNRVRASSLERYEGVLRNHILPMEWFSSKPVDEIKRRDVKNLLIDLVGQRHSPHSIEIIHTVINSIFGDAIDDEILAINPATGLLRKLLPPKRQRNQSDAQPILDPGELNLFLKHLTKTCPKPIELIIKVMLYGGLRLGESICLRVENLDIEGEKYNVTETYKREVYSKPKTGVTRFVDFPAFLIKELKDQILTLKKDQLRQQKPAKISLMFCDRAKHGQPYSQRKIQAAVKKVCTSAGIGMRSPHDLRHTYATWLLMKHVPVVYVQKQLGHSSIETTVAHYSHWIDGEGKPDLEKLLQPAEEASEICTLVHIEKEKSS